MIIFTVQGERTITYRESPEEIIEAIDNTNENVDLSEKVDPLRTGKKMIEGNNAIGCGKEDSRACC